MTNRQNENRWAWRFMFDPGAIQCDQLRFQIARTVQPRELERLIQRAVAVQGL